MAGATSSEGADGVLGLGAIRFGSAVGAITFGAAGVVFGGGIRIRKPVNGRGATCLTFGKVTAVVSP